MTKQQIIEFLKEDHKKMEFVVNSLHKEEFLKFRIQDSWNVKDIIAHLTAWNFELVKMVDVLLKDEKPWFVDDYRKTKQLETEFNKIQVIKRKSHSLEDVIDEWQQSFESLVKKIESLRDNELNYISSYFWEEGSPVTVKSLFGYRYKGEGHEGGHAKIVEEYFDEDHCSCRNY